MSSSDATTSVPAASLTDAGFVAPAETDILTGVQADITAALGGNVNQALTTPQGQLATSETAIIGDCNDQLLALFNGFDPRNASGRQQDAIGYIYFMERLTGESRADFEARREDIVAANSIGTNASLLGALLNLSGVNDAYVVDNPSDTDATIGGVTVSARRLFVCVSGGTASDIGLAILQKKPPCSMTMGSSSVTVKDPNSAYNDNGPSYTFNYTEATDTPIYVAVSLTNSSAVPSTALAQIQAAIVDVFNGTDDGDTKARIGSEIYASQFYAAVAALGSWVKIVDVFVGTSASPTATTTQMTIAQRPTISADNISLTLV